MNHLLTTLVFSLSLIPISHSQESRISDESTTFIQTGVLTDSGGKNSAYGNNESFIKTICPSNANEFIKLDFIFFETEKGVDILTVYHHPKLAGESIELSGIINPAPIISKHESGCVTLHFYSNSTKVFEGFEATISTSSTPPETLLDKSGGAICSLAAPFCTSSSYNFPNSVNEPNATGANFGCLGSTPNPIWYYMQIENPGDLIISLRQTGNSDGTGAQRDIDFAMWGPYSNTTEACNAIHTNLDPPLQCSYSSSYTETIALGNTGGFAGGQSTPPNGITNEIYMILLTNYSNSPGYISFSQTGGSASTNCSILSLSANLLSFKGEHKNGVNEIHWSALYNSKVTYFTIEKSTDGFNWKNLAELEIEEEKSTYSIFDTEYENTINYYRLIEHNQYGISNRLSTLLIDNTLEYKKVSRIVNLIGQDIDETALGLKIYIYEDGSSEKKIN